MTVGLRKITMSRWVDRPNDFPRGEVTADSVTDLKTYQNSLSVFVVPPDDPAALIRVASAMTCDKTSLEPFEYCLFPIEGVLELGLRIRSVPGKTSDNVVNSWHRDIIDLTGAGLVSFAVFLSGIPASRMLKSDVAKELVVGWAQDRYSRRPKCERDLQKFGFPTS